MKRKIENFLTPLLYFGTSKNEFEAVYPMVIEKNNQTFSVVARVSMFLCFVLLVGSYCRELNGYLSGFRFILRLAVVIFALLTLAFSSNKERSKKLIMVHSYALLFSVYILVTMLGTAYNNKEIATAMMVFLFALPLLITDIPFRVIVMQILASILFLVSSYNFKSPEIYHEDLVSCMIYLCLSIAITCFRQKNNLETLALFNQVKLEGEIDKLTGVMRKDSGAVAIRDRLERAPQEPAALIIFDMDNFKSINDTFGHDNGDKVLIAVGKVLRQLFSEEDIIFRYGGDEFVILFEGTNTKDKISAKINMVRRILHHALSGSGVGNVTCSFGVALVGTDGYSFEELFKKADNALYAAKRTGKNGICFYQ